MNSGWIQVFATIIGVVGLTTALVAPLYIKFMELYRSVGVGDEMRGNIRDDIDGLAEKADQTSREVRNLRAKVEEVEQRSEANQRHIHDLLVKTEREDEEDFEGDPHQTGGCLFGDSCPFHAHGAI